MAGITQDVRVALSNQMWRSDDGTCKMSGDHLAPRMWDRRLWKTKQETFEIISQMEVGQCIKTGVSAWERIS